MARAAGYIVARNKKVSARTLKSANYNLIIGYRLGPALGWEKLSVIGWASF
jgi:hypothetical protein